MEDSTINFLRKQLADGALDIPVEPTEPPSQSARVLGVELSCGPSDLRAPTAVVVGIGEDGVMALRGVPDDSCMLTIPALPEGFSPLAEVLLLPAQACVTHRRIWKLKPGEKISRGRLSKWRSGTHD